MIITFFVIALYNKKYTNNEKKFYKKYYII